MTASKENVIGFIMAALIILGGIFGVKLYWNFCQNNPDYTRDVLATQRARWRGQIPVKVIQ